MKRDFNYDIMTIIQERWSTKTFKTTAIPDDDLNAIFEAARYAPSCFNEQPWRFIIGRKNEGLEELQGFLTEKNYLWAKTAPVLVLIITSNQFKYNQKNNPYCKFDAGTAWGFLQLEAWKRGYATHGMAGFSKKRAREALKIPESYDLVAMFAMGVLETSEDQANTRMPLEEITLGVDAFRP